MPFYVLIPFVACMGACAIASVVIARDPSARRSRLAAGILACAALWGFCDLLAHVFNSREAALSLVRMSTLPILAIPPLALQLLLEENARVKQRFPGLLVPIWFCVTLLVPVSMFSPLLISSVVWTDWGWMTRLGSFHFLFFVPGTACVLAAFYVLKTQSSVIRNAQSRHVQLLALLATLLLAVIPVGEILAPALEIDAPRLGALSVTVLATSLWFLSLSLGEYAPAPTAFAREMLDTLSDGVALINRGERIRAANLAFAQLAGGTPGELIDQSVTDRFGIPFAEMSEAKIGSETTLERSDGSTIPVSATRSELLDEGGSLLGSVLVIRDLRDVTRLRRRLVAAGRMAAVGELAAGIVHEVNNPIAFIQSNLHCLHKNDAALMEILENEMAPNPVPEPLREVRHLVGQSLQNIARVASIVKEIRGFSHMGPTGIQSNDVNRLIEDVVSIALPQLRSHATVVREYGDLPEIECAGQDIRHALLDLLLSAARSLEGGGMVRLHTEAQADSIIIEVEDDGRGHTPEQVARIFDPTMGRPDAEVGTDLCVAYQIVRQQGGEIAMESDPGRGTKVTVRLPKRAPAAIDESQNEDLLIEGGGVA
ncbi:MAG: PAS domain S-box-containing protein [Myxococcota bacterium]|jgi:PAS domain S-box-containing protein